MVRKTAILLIHAAYWLSFLSLLFLFFFFTLLMPFPAKHSLQKADIFLWGIRLVTGFAVVPSILSFYSFYILLFKKFLSRKKFLGFFVWGIIVSVFSAMAGAMVESLPFLFGPRFLFGDGYTSSAEILAFMSFLAFVNGIIASVIKGFITWYQEIRLKEVLAKKNYDMELSLLKSKINPHFLFNTINNIDVLITKDAVMASACLNKLADIMRFMLYETNTDSISLDKELDYIQKYIALQKIRMSNPNYIIYSVQGNTEGVFIPPMLFIPFIENAFKHSVNSTTGNVIRVNITVQKDMLTFNCENRSSKNSHHTAPLGGLGNDLIKKRIALLYPGKHVLTVTNDDNMYTVNLQLRYHDH